MNLLRCAGHTMTRWKFLLAMVTFASWLVAAAIIYAGGVPFPAVAIACVLAVLLLVLTAPLFVPRVVELSIFGVGSLTPRQRWMLYPVYGATVLVCLQALVVVATLNETREFIGDKGVEYCWMYGSFHRYLSTNLVLICLDVALLLSLYWLVRRNRLIIYLVVWAIWLLGEPLLSVFDMSYC